MTDDKREQDSHETREVRGYERMLDQVRHAFSEFGDDVRPRLRYAVERARERMVELGELSREEADRIAGWLRRDIEEAADYSAKTDEDLNAWLHMDIQLVENWIWDRFSSVADQTRLDWIRFQEGLQRASEYRTGEVAGPGTLACQSCGETMHFTRAGHIPPCPKCNGTVFVRPSAQS